MYGSTICMWKRMMENRFFSDTEIQILAQPQQWKIVCPPKIKDKIPVRNKAHEEWMINNSHLDSHAEVLIILKGSGYFGCNSEVYEITPGTIFVMEPFVEHDVFYPDDQRDFEHIWVFVFKDRCVYQRLSAFSDIQRPPDIKQIMVCDTSSTGGALLYQAGGCDRLRLHAALNMIIYSVISKGYEIEEQAFCVSFQSEVIEAICRHIQDTAGRATSLDILARISGYSKYHFHRIFQQHTGMNVHDYVDMCRLQKAKRMKEEGRLKKEIASELGFSCLAAYSRWNKSKE